MFCDACGGQLTEGSSFCANCGKAVGLSPVVPARGRIAGHLQLLGILWLALGAFRMIPALVMIALAVARILPPGVPEFVRAVLPMLGVLFLVVGMVSIVTGGGLFARQSWARRLAIVFGGLNLVDIPFGTALGIYTLWVLIPEESEREYNLIVRG